MKARLEPWMQYVVLPPVWRRWLAIGVLLFGPGFALACGPFSLGFYELGLLYYRSGQGPAQGIDLDVIEALKARSGCAFEPVLESRVRIWSRLAAGQLDVSVSGIATPERERFAEFMPYFSTRNFLVGRREAVAAGLDPSGFLARPELQVAVVKSFKHGPLYDEWLERLRSQGRVVEAADFDTVVRLFVGKRVDAFLALPTSWALVIRRHNLEDQVQVLDWAPQERIVHGLIVSKLTVSEPDRRRLRNALHSLHTDGSIERILRYHMGSEWASHVRLPELQALER
ncbi:substrate-binding periplasmic protein [Inhella gelatinilytica]|uniref:Transporter substrate-binding domain-containing protein n=1 Tax=Inhella gelatinilytica TaxID=2795030 RepID=A0A931IVW1_9BURK|nr:transporter substrate-binding domain-containing protein [Inhella gelatinilytica]MBH9553795.1 transporter substrate-binding domain-containing protein [Inhella gelatinilytica]